MDLPYIGAKYKLEVKLGQGSFGSVFKGLDTELQEMVAIKLMPRGNQTKYVEAEFVNHSRLAGHPHVINFKEVFITDEHLCLAMEYAVGGTLLQYINRRGRLSESLARRFFQQLILALDYCHKMRIAVRDIKLENVLLQNPPNQVVGANSEEGWLLKLCDFGYSKSENKSAMKSKVGTLVYMAPEILTTGRTGNYDGKAADIWSCGIMLYIMLCGRYPYDSPVDSFANQDDIVNLLNMMQTRQFPIPSSVQISDSCKEFLMSLLQPKPAERLTMAQIYQHPWFRTDLPDSVLGYNDYVINNSSTYRNQVQSPEQIKQILRQAQHNPYRDRLSGHSTFADHDDAIIDSEIAKEQRR